MSDESLPSYPLGSELMTLVSSMAATISQGLMATTGEVWTTNSAAACAVEMAIAIANEVREYRIVNNRAVKPDAS